MPKPCSKRTRNWAKRCGDWMSARWKRRTCFRRADGEETIHQFLWNGIRSSEVKIGILAVQGDFEAHAAMLQRLGAETAEVRTPAQLEQCDGLVLPGGESTTQLQFLQEEGLFEAIKKVAANNFPVLGTCAGAILLATHVDNPPQASLGLLDMSVLR